jgi:hypothetical protein
MMRVRRWDTGVNDIDAGRVDAPFLERITHGAGDGDESRDALSVLDPSTRHKSHASRDDKRDSPASDQRGKGDGVSPGVVGVHDVGSPCPKPLHDSAGGAKVPVAGRANRGNCEPGTSRPSQQR